MKKSTLLLAVLTVLLIWGGSVLLYRTAGPTEGQSDARPFTARPGVVQRIAGAAFPAESDVPAMIGARQVPFLGENFDHAVYPLVGARGSWR